MRAQSAMGPGGGERRREAVPSCARRGALVLLLAFGGFATAATLTSADLGPGRAGVDVTLVVAHGSGDGDDGSSWTVGRPAGGPVPGSVAGNVAGSARDSVGETLSGTVDSGVHQGSSWT
jgi:hypothetical protein